MAVVPFPVKYGQFMQAASGPEPILRLGSAGDGILGAAGAENSAGGGTVLLVAGRGTTGLSELFAADHRESQNERRPTDGVPELA